MHNGAFEYECVQARQSDEARCAVVKVGVITALNFGVDRGS